MTDEDITGPHERGKLSDEDAELIADKVLKKAEQKFFFNAGKGIFNIAIKALVMGTFALAVYGYAHGWFH